MDELRPIFGDEALTFEQLAARLAGQNGPRIVDISAGGYVPQADVDAMRMQFDAQLAAERLDNALNLALAGAHARDPRLVKSLLDTGALRVNGQTIIGLDEQLETIRQSHGYLFQEDNPGLDGGARVDSGAHHAAADAPDFARMSDAEYFAYLDSRR